jgi:hypothetical protein
MDGFEEHLIATAKSYGFVEPKTSNWIRYMKSDVERGEVVINYLVQNFGLKTTDLSVYDRFQLIDEHKTSG